MQVGDPKKTAFLSVIAVGALFFCYKQLTGGANEPRVLREAPGAAGAGDAGGQPAPSGSVVTMQLDQLHADPFSHPRLAPKGAPPMGGGEVTAPPSNPGGQLPAGDPGGPVGPFGNPSGGIGPLQMEKERPGTWPVPVNPGQKPADITIDKVTQITLKAIVTVGDREVYLAVDGKEARSYKSGDFIGKDIQITFVNGESVILENKSKKKTVTLKVGQQGDL